MCDMDASHQAPCSLSAVCAAPDPRAPLAPLKPTSSLRSRAHPPLCSLSVSIVMIVDMISKLSVQQTLDCQEMHFWY